MADSVIKRGRDTHTNSAKADKEFAQNKWPVLSASGPTRKVFVFLPMPGVRGKTIEQATLSVPVKGSTAAQTLTATPVDERWVPRQVTHNLQPNLRTGEAVTDAQGAKSDGERWEIDVTAFAQSVASGAKNFGLCITTSDTSANRVYGFDAPGNDSWKLAIDFIEAPEIPTDLYPAGQTVEGKPRVSFEFVDLGGESTEQESLQVQVNSSASSSGAWDSGEVVTALPEYDLDGNWTTTPVDGTTYYWRVRVKDGAGYWSEWSDWASFVYDPKPVITFNAPTGGEIWDPSPTIDFEIDSGQIKMYRVKVAKGDDKTKVLYDSGKLVGTNTTQQTHPIPFKQHGKRVLRDDENYWLQVRVLDRLDRQAPAWTGEWVQFHLDDDAVPAAPADLTAAQIGDSPRVRLTWTRSGTTDGWVIVRDGQIVARLDADEVESSSGTYSWTDLGCPPMGPHVYKVKAIDNGTSKQTTPSEEVAITTELGGVWLLTDEVEVRLRGNGVEGMRTADRRASYRPLNLPYDIDVVHAFEGVVGSFQGGIEAQGGEDWNAARATLLALKEQPSQVVQFAYGTTSVPVLLRNVNVGPSASFQPHNMRHDVYFEVQQVDDFWVEV